MRRHLRPLRTLGLAALPLFMATACGSTQSATLPDFRAKGVEAVRSKFDARGARVETHKAKHLYEVKLWMKDPASGRERLAATCWFDENRRLVLVRYAE